MIYQFDKFRVDTGSRELLRGDRPVALEPRALRMLEYLIEHRDRSISKDELQAEVWGTIVGDAAIARCVTKLRKALGDAADTPRMLRTVRGHGYRFIAPVNRQDDDTTRPDNDGAERPAIAVLPLTSIGGNGEDSWFADGIADEILALLARVPDLRVVSRTSAFVYRKKDKDLRTIASNLGANFVLDGSVRRHDSRVRISVQLVDARTDTSLWSQIFDRELTDIFAVQSEIAAAVVSELKVATRAHTRRYDATSSIDAYDYYLRGRYYFHNWTQESLEYAAQMFERAIEIDPKFAKAWAGLAESVTCDQMWRDGSGEMLQRAQEASQRALEIAPYLAETHCARAFVLTVTGDYDESAEEFERALAMDPMYFEAWYLYARSRFAEGRLDEAARLFARAGDLRPDDYQSMCLCALAHSREGGDAQAARNAADESVQRCRRILDLCPDDTRALALGASSLQMLGRNEEAQRWADRALAIAPNDITVLHNVGCYYAAAGDIDTALDLFERRFEIGTIFRDWVDHDPDFDELRDHPRFRKMLRVWQRQEAD